MSQRDIERDRDLMRSFQGRHCFVSLHTNSIRLRIDDKDKQGHYIWIDPPWVFSHEREEITSSEGYSEETEDSFRNWCNLFEPLRDTVLEQFEEIQEAAVTFAFHGGHRLFVPDNGTREEGMEYDHWYALDRKT